MRLRHGLELAALGIALTGCATGFGGLAPGTRMRLLIPSDSPSVSTGRLVAISPESISVTRDPGSPDRRVEALADTGTVPIGALGRLQRSRGMHRYTVEGLALGMLVTGPLAFAAAGWDGCMVMCGSDSHPPASQAAYVAAMVGTAVGGYLLRRERWRDIPLTRPSRLRLDVSLLIAGKAGLGAVVRF